MQIRTGSNFATSGGQIRCLNGLRQLERGRLFRGRACILHADKELLDFTLHPFRVHCESTSAVMHSSAAAASAEHEASRSTWSHTRQGMSTFKSRIWPHLLERAKLKIKWSGVWLHCLH